MIGPLKGLTVLITRGERQAKVFSERVEASGGQALEVPLLNINCASTKLKFTQHQPLTQYDWVFFTSANGVHCFFQAAEKHGIDLSMLSTLNMAAVGPKTDQALKHYGWQAQFIPSVYNAAVMAAEFLPIAENPKRILLVQGNWSRPVLTDFFTEQAFKYDVVVAYETSINEQAADQLNKVLQNNKINFFTFTSPSTVNAFADMAVERNYDPEQEVCVCIGTTTEKAAQKRGFKNILTPSEFTIDGMIGEMITYTERMNENG